jgi:hypothetical protein
VRRWFLALALALAVPAAAANPPCDAACRARAAAHRAWAEWYGGQCERINACRLHVWWAAGGPNSTFDAFIAHGASRPIVDTIGRPHEIDAFSGACSGPVSAASGFARRCSSDPNEFWETDWPVSTGSCRRIGNRCW